MPNTTKAKHPNGKLGITFTEEDHRYVDDNGMEYVSCTKLMHSAFAPFDAPKAAAMKSAKTGIPAEQYLAEWKESGRRASEAGTRAHENCERQILGRLQEMHQPLDPEERLRFRAAWHEVAALQNQFPRIWPEVLVFSPRFCCAGSIDLLCKLDADHYAIGDWKYVKRLEQTAFGGRTGIHPATRDVPDCNFWRYAIQLNIYQAILKIEGYIPPAAKVDRFLKRYNPETHEFEHVPIPEMALTAMMLLAYNGSVDNSQPDPDKILF